MQSTSDDDFSLFDGVFTMIFRSREKTYIFNIYNNIVQVV